MSSYLRVTGPGYDLESQYLKQPTKTLPDPSGFPFDLQGIPIYFDQPHINSQDVSIATHTATTNPLPYNRFVGVGLPGQSGPPKQINQPDFLSINDTITFQ